MQMTQQALMLGHSLEAGKEALASSSSSSSLSAVGPRSRERHISENYGSTGSSDGSLKENRPDNQHSQPQAHARTELNGGRERHSSGTGKRSSSSPTSSPSGGGGGGGGGAAGNSFSSSSPPSSSSVNAVPSLVVSTEKLFGHGRCQWPGCDAACADMGQFRRHLGEAHAMDDKAAAQARVQAQMVAQLELQLGRERDRLGAMMRHLNLELRAGGELKERKEHSLPPPPPSSSSPPPSFLPPYNPYMDRLTSDRRSPPRSPSPKRFKRESPPHMRGSPFGLASSTSSSSPLALGPLQHLQGKLTQVPPSLSAGLSQQHQSPLSALTAAVRSPLLAGSPVSSSASPTTVPASSSVGGGGGPIRPKPTSTLVDKSPSTPLPLPPGKSSIPR